MRRAPLSAYFEVTRHSFCHSLMIMSTVAFWWFHSQVQRGTIACRKDPRDMEEWQFALDKEVAYKDTKSKHVVAFEASQKMEALDWMKARQCGSMNTGDGFQGEDALSDVLPDKAKGKKNSQLALMDKGNGEEEGEEEEATHDPMTTALGKAAQDAEVLSDLGKSKNKELAAKRVLKMVTLVKDVKKKADTANQKDLQATLSDLEKLSKKGKALSLESCKDKLLDAALAVKKVQKTLKK